MNSKHPLLEISEFVAAEAKKSRVAAIFDLDSTLFCVSPRTQAILRKLGESEDFRRTFADASEVLRHIEVLPTDWGIRTTLERTKIQYTPEMITRVRDFWRANFFANHFLDRDEIYPSANEYVRHLHDLGAKVLYLTGRADVLMREGTRRVLQHWGFPFFDDSMLLMKPNEAQTDEGFKAKALSELVKQFDHIWFFENEPVIIEQVRPLVPQVRIVFVDSVHSGRTTRPTDLPTIGTSYSEGLAHQTALAQNLKRPPK